MAENILTKEVAGLPVGAWAAVVAGGLGLAYFFNKQQVESEAEREPLVAPGVGTGLVPAGSAFRISEDGTSEEGFANNLAWARAAKDWLIGQGHDPTVADNAVRKYVAAEDLTVQEDALISLVLSELGAPPEGLPPTNVPGEPQQGEPQQGAPDIRITSGFELTLDRGERGTITGVVTIGGNSPGSPQTVTFDMFSPKIPALRIHTEIVQTNSNGAFSVPVGPLGTPRGGRVRLFRVSFKGESAYGRIRRIG